MATNMLCVTVLFEACCVRVDVFPYASSGSPDRSVSPCGLAGIFAVHHIHPLELLLSADEQGGPWVGCADVRAVLGLRCSHVGDLFPPWGILLISQWLL